MKGLIIIGVIGMVPGIYLLVRGFQQYQHSLASREWPSVTGHIIDVCVDGIRTRGGLMYHPRVEYTYSVDDQTYTGKQRAIGDDWWTSKWSASLEEARAQIKGYQAEHPVTVYYNPDRPEQATLKPGETQGARSTLLVGAGITVIGIVALALGFLNA